MKALSLEETFGLEQLRLVEREDRHPRRGEILLEMKAASLNYRDLLLVKGHYDPRQPLPLIPGSDGVGVVIAVGEGVERFAEGDRVLPIFAQRWIAGPPTRERLRSTLGGPLDGVLCERMVISAEAAVLAPPHLSHLEAATLPCAALTAWTALVVEGGLKAGDTVLVQGSGGVSIFALQLAKLFGARVIATSSSDEKLERMCELGADVGVNYKKEPKWGRKVRQLAGGEGVDIVVEVGGAHTLGESLKALRVGGFIGMIGVLSGTRAPVDLLPLLMGYVRIQGILVGNRDNFEAMNLALGAAQLRPVLDRTFPLSEVGLALETMASGAHFGKIVIEIG
ncbi:MAG: NAD(P)-dependent alcohol dehydrogenase [Deltaproteobacteria bacterium]|nr:NAD(P)-dependent alcohol dehydrogenase [Deltaproteobacteria bacterium]